MHLNMPSDRQCWYSSTCLQTGSVDTARHAFRQAVLIQLNMPSDRQCWYSSTCLQTGSVDTAQYALRQFLGEPPGQGRLSVCGRSQKYIKYFCNTTDRAMGQAFSCLPLTTETWIQFYSIPCGICGGQSGTVTGFSLSAFGFHYQLRFHNTPYSFIHNRRYVMWAVYSVVQQRNETNNNCNKGNNWEVKTDLKDMQF
jgi:hypothetical protein